MYRFKYSILAIILLIGCRKDTEKAISRYPEGSVGFHVRTMQTRGTPVMQPSELTEFKVLAYQHADTWDQVSAADPASVFFSHTSVTRDKNDQWSYSPLRYWPSMGNISFFGYSPSAATGDTPNQYGLSITTPVDGTAPVISYKVPTAIENQPDLMISITGNYDLNLSNSADIGVNMVLSHALTCVGFKAVGNGEHITKVKVSGVVGTGSLTLGTSVVTWSIDPDAETCEFEAGVNDEPLDGNPSSILTDDGYLMMIPQTLTSQAKVTVTIDGGSDPYEQTFSLDIPEKQIWEAGRFVEYTFAVQATGSIMLNPESLLLPALAGSYSVFSVICPEEDPNAAWTVNTPSNGWLRIIDNLSPTGYAAASDTYTGHGTTLLYAYAPNANTSTTTELSSTISLEGSSQKITVKQLYQNEVYEPDIPHDGWAGSNIYWVSDESYPDGGYLTFDDKNVITHEQYQGVYFMWGSLVALSPLGNTWTGGIWNGTSGQILYIPNQDPATNGGWNPATNSGWGYIPRMGWENNSGTDISSNPNNGGKATPIVQNTTQSYLYQKHNPQGNVGDICKYITDMGWAPGAKEGRKWRMPVNTEYNNCSTDYKQVGDFAYQQPVDRFGRSLYAMGFRRTVSAETPFFPASGYRYDRQNGGFDTYTGYRPGEAISIWTASPRVSSFGQYGDALDFVMDGGSKGLTNTQGFPRNTGSTVRCVMEVQSSRK